MTPSIPPVRLLRRYISRYLSYLAIGVFERITLRLLLLFIIIIALLFFKTARHLLPVLALDCLEQLARASFLSVEHLLALLASVTLVTFILIEHALSSCTYEGVYFVAFYWW